MHFLGVTCPNSAMLVTDLRRRATAGTGFTWVYRRSSTSFIANCHGKYLGVHETAEGAACLVETYLKSADAPQPKQAAVNPTGYEGVYAAQPSGFVATLRGTYIGIGPTAAAAAALRDEHIQAQRVAQPALLQQHAATGIVPRLDTVVSGTPRLSYRLTKSCVQLVEGGMAVAREYLPAMQIGFEAFAQGIGVKEEASKLLRSADHFIICIDQRRQRLIGFACAESRDIRIGCMITLFG